MGLVSYFGMNDIDGTPCGAGTKQAPLIPKPQHNIPIWAMPFKGKFQFSVKNNHIENVILEGLVLKPKWYIVSLFNE